MKNLIALLICLFACYHSRAQDKYFVTASDGLFVREAASVDAKQIGGLPYGSIVTLLEKKPVGVNDENSMVKISFVNFPYIVVNANPNKLDFEGYVSSNYLEKLNKATVISKEIDSVKFSKLYKKPNRSSLKKITSVDSIKQLLAGKVNWKNVEYLGNTIDQIILKSGRVLYINQKNNDFGLVAYYPTEQILLFEGGHTSDYSISTATGESLATVGNPDYIQDSPSKKFRLNGWFQGQECSNYFFQQKTGKGYKYLVDFGWGSERFGKGVCYFKEFCWINDGTCVYSYDDASGKKTKIRYFTGQIKQ